MATSNKKKPTGILNANVSSAIKKLTTVAKKPTPKKTSVVTAAKPIIKAIQSGANAVTKAAKPVAKAAGTGKVSSIASATAGKGSAKKETFNLDAEVKKTMSGAYGSGAARKKALGANYSKVQAEINKRSAANKPKTTSTPTKSERVEIGSLPLRKVTEADLKPSPKPAAPVVKTSGGSGLGTKEKTDQEMEKQGFRRGGSVKRKMKNGGVKPKAMYGVSMKPGMMKRGGMMRSKRK